MRILGRRTTVYKAKRNLLDRAKLPTSRVKSCLREKYLIAIVVKISNSKCLEKLLI